MALTLRVQDLEWFIDTIAGIFRERKEWEICVNKHKILLQKVVFQKKLKKFPYI